MLRRPPLTYLLLLAALSLLVMACSSTSKWDDLPEQEQHWQTVQVLGGGTPFWIAAWGYELDKGPLVSAPAVPVLMIACNTPSRLYPDDGFWRSVEIWWGIEEIDQYFTGATFITEFKRPGRRDLRETDSWYVFQPGTTGTSVWHDNGESFIRKARHSWLMEVRTYRQEGLPVGNFHFDLRGLTELMEKDPTCKQ